MNKEAEIAHLDPQVQQKNHASEVFKQANGKLQKTQKEAAQITEWLQQRYYWGDFLADMRRALLRSEDVIKKKLSIQKPGVEAGIWIEQMIAAANLGAPSTGVPNAALPPAGLPGMPGGMPGMPGMPGMYPGQGMRPPGEMPPANPPADASTTTGAITNTLTLVCRAVNLTSVDPSANSEIAYAVENEVKKSVMVDPKTTSLVGNIVPDDSNGTFTFTLNVTPTNQPTFNPPNP